MSIEELTKKAETIVDQIVVLPIPPATKSGVKNLWAVAPSSAGGWYKLHVVKNAQGKVTLFNCECQPKNGPCYHKKALALRMQAEAAKKATKKNKRKATVA